MKDIIKMLLIGILMLIGILAIIIGAFLIHPILGILVICGIAISALEKL